MQRLPQLDGLRGVASLTVVFEHALLVFPALYVAFGNRNADLPLSTWILTYTPLHLFWAGGEAVAIFFVLSGCVLSWPYWRNANKGYIAFVIQRIFRLYPVYLMSLALSLAGAVIAQRHAVDVTSDWFARYAIAWPDWSDYARAVLFTNGSFLSLNAPLWTLIHEWRISLLFPLLVLAVRASPRLVLPAAVAVSFSAKIMIAKGWVSGDIGNLTETIAQTWLFVAGALIARYWERISRRLGQGSLPLIAGLFSAGLVLLLLHWIVEVPSALSYLATGVGATLIVCLIGASAGASRLFASPLVAGLGRVSYPLYSLHFPILVIVVHLFSPAIGLVMSVLVAIAAALALSWVVNLWVEEPMIRLGRSATRAVAPAVFGLGPAPDNPRRQPDNRILP